MNDLLTGALGPFGPIIAVGSLGLMLVLMMLPMLLRGEKDPLDKLKQPEKRNDAPKGRSRTERLRTNDGKDKLEKYSTFLEPQDAEAYSEARLKMLQAGYRSKNAVRIYHFLQFVLGFGFLILGVLYAINNATGTPPHDMILSC